MSRPSRFIVPPPPPPPPTPPPPPPTLANASASLPSMGGADSDFRRQAPPVRGRTESPDLNVLTDYNELSFRPKLRTRALEKEARYSDHSAQRDSRSHRSQSASVSSQRPRVRCVYPIPKQKLRGPLGACASYEAPRPRIALLPAGSRPSARDSDTVRQISGQQFVAESALIRERNWGPPRCRRG